MNVNSNNKQITRSKIFDYIKEFKNRVIENIKICYFLYQHLYFLTYDNKIMLKNF